LAVVANEVDRIDRTEKKQKNKAAIQTN